jgi:hypothetical protein
MIATIPRIIVEAPLLLARGGQARPEGGQTSPKAFGKKIETRIDYWSAAGGPLMRHINSEAQNSQKSGINSALRKVAYQEQCQPTGDGSYAHPRSLLTMAAVYDSHGVGV